MENNKKDRTQLKSYFKSNAVPTEQNFKDLIDANLNQKEDGIVKIPNGALAIQSASTTEELIHFYKSFDDANPTWKFNQKPTDRAGFNISDGAGTSRLFIDVANGNVGLSNNAPVARLDVNTLDNNGVLIRSGNSASAVANSQLTFGYNGTAQYRHAVKTRHNAGALAGNPIDFYVWKQGTDTLDTVGTQQVMTLDGNGNMGVGINAPTAKVHVIANGGSGNPEVNGLFVFNPSTAASQDAIICAKVNGAAAGNPYLSLDVKGIGGWSMGIDNADGQALKFSSTWNTLTSTTRMTLNRSGNLGIGVAPIGKLDVNTLDANGIVVRSGNGYNTSDYSQITMGYGGTSNHRNAIKTRSHSGDAFYNAIDFYLWTPADAAGNVGTKHGMSITGAGNVGIGINAPTAKLHVLANGNANPESNGVYVYNPTSAAGQDAILAARVNQTGGGNPFISLDVAGIIGWSIGIDNKDAQKLKFSNQWNSVSGVPRMTIDRSGYVGIGTTAPRWPLHVVGAASTGWISGNGAAMDRDKYNNGWDNNVWANLSILADDAIGTRTFFCCHENILTGSDARIKSVIGRSNIQQDLDTLCRIQVTDYRHTDTRTHGNGIQKKIIAQEVEAVFPQAVRQRVETIPDIYADASSTVFDASKQLLIIELETAPELTAGDFVDLMGDKGRNQYEVLAVDGNVFTVKAEEDPGNVFVYGKQVSDFRFVDYDSLFMLGISSIQALNGEVNALKAEVSGLKKTLAAYSA
jgi:hypothetical protein